MKKKINCKHGLDIKQEMEARRIRNKLEHRDKDVLKEFRDMFEEYLKQPRTYSYIMFLKNKNLVYYSVLLRIMGEEKRSSIFRDIFVINDMEN